MRDAAANPHRRPSRNVYQVAGALNYIGVSAAAIGQDIKNFFSVDYDGSMVWYLEESGLTPTQIAGALQGAFNDSDTAVASGPGE